ncbi:MAG: SPW repeat protein [Proteobacteria bacterium]|nr:SPW repeat protein [Pseudomonadota bacterium]
MTGFWQTLSRRWQDGLNLLLGIWLILSPWVLAYATVQYAAWNAYAVGVVIAVAAVAALVAFHEWEEWVNLLFGVWLIVSPWLLKFDTVTAALWNQIAVGLVVGILAG